MSASTRAILQQVKAALASQKASNAAAARDEQEQAATFLLAEHTRLCELYLETRQTADRRSTLFLTLTTTIVGILAAAFQFKLAPRDFLETALVGALGIVILGAITFHRLIERSMQGTEYLRAINRIHRFFVERAPEIEPYLYWPANDDLPAYDLHGVGGAEQREIVVLINSLALGVSIALALLTYDSSEVALALGAALGGMIVAAFLHREYERFAMAREARLKAGLVRFPREP